MRSERDRDVAAARARGKRLIARLAPKPVLPYIDKGEAMRPAFGTEPTVRELVILAEYMIHGVTTEASECLGLSESTTRNHLGNLYARLGCVSGIQAAVALGWIAWPRALPVKRHVVASAQIPDVPTFKRMIEEGLIR